ncbi:hypothetical protein O181_042151 [Austropuccinia psidii MF-1]|uniref:Uncharacterized protein n=1 Tax=Austropuccinia psidii MF-1 TaxID=1389203 RepID=A0A9Q3HEV9_9BASI|nr:hypothetical protein [Austropuccinia psidii MF-1]
MLEKGWNTRLPADTLRKYLIYIHPTASSFKIILYKVKHYSKQRMNDNFNYAKQKCDKSHKVPYFKVGDLAPVPNLNFNNIKGPKKPKYYCVGAFILFPYMDQIQFKWNLVVNWKINAPLPIHLDKTFSTS